MSKRLKFLGEVYEAERVVKTGNSIIGYTGSSVVFLFRGINDFSQFQLLDNADFDPDPEAEREQHIADLDAAIAAILGGAI